MTWHWGPTKVNVKNSVGKEDDDVEKGRRPGKKTTNILEEEESEDDAEDDKDDIGDEEIIEGEDKENIDDKEDIEDRQRGGGWQARRRSKMLKNCNAMKQKNQRTKHILLERKGLATEHHIIPKISSFRMLVDNCERDYKLFSNSIITWIILATIS